MDTETLHKQQMETPNGPSGRNSEERLKAASRGALAIVRASGIPLVAGVLGSLTAVLVMGVLRLIVGSPTLPELLAERILLTLNANDFVSLLVKFQPNSKTTPLALTLLGQFLIGILLGPLFYFVAGRPDGRRGFWPGRRAWITAAIFVVVMEAVGIALFWPVLDAGLVGDPSSQARVITSLCMLAAFIGFVGVTMLATHWLQRAWLPRRAAATAASLVAAEATSADASGISRRKALGAAGVVVLAVAAGGVGIDRLLESYLARSNLSYEGMKTLGFTPITAIKDFYVVSKNVLDPTVDSGRWELEVGGLVGQSKTWNYDQVRALPSETRAVTFECIANGVGGHLMGTAQWTGVLLKTVLDEAGDVQPSGTYVIFTSVDGYQYCQSLENLMEARAMLAWEMNGQPLPERHGYPLRLVMPGRFGEQSVKWLTRIDVTDQLYTGGLYQSQGWSSAPVPTTSRFDQPGAGSKVPLGPLQLAGVAFAGIRGIQQVEVSVDDGVTWHTASLMLPLSDQSWVLWNWIWTPPARGTYMLVVRATDGTGALQIETQRGTVPEGATGWYHLTLQVV